jgi:hypothetical protein
MSSELQKELSKVTETFEYEVGNLKYKLHRLKVILKLLENDTTLTICSINDKMINKLIDEYNKTNMNSLTKSIKWSSNPDIKAIKLFENVFNKSENESHPNTIVEKTIKFHFEKLKGLIDSIDSENLEKSNTSSLAVHKLKPPELNLNLINDTYVQRITSYIDSMCTVVFTRNQGINETTDDNARESSCYENQVLKDAKNILIPFLKYKSTITPVKTGGRKNKTVARKIMRRRSCRKKQKLVV